MTEVLSLLALLAGLIAVLLACLALIRRGRAAAERARRAEALLAVGPAHIFVHAGGTWEGVGPAAGRTLAAALRPRPADAEALDAALGRLAAKGEPFTLAVAGTNGRHWRLRGTRTAQAAPEAVVAVTDETAAVGRAARLEGMADAASAEAARLRALLDAVPLPVWARAPDLGLLWCNRAYAAAIEAPGPLAAVAESREMAQGVLGRDGRELARRARRTGSSQSESQAVVLHGSRRLLDFTEAATPDGLFGWARDLTDVEALQTDLARLIEAHGEVLQQLRSGIAIFAADRRLRFANRAYADLWRLDPSWLETEPDLGEILARLRELRRLPEVVDFQSFREAQLAAFRSVMTQVEDYLYLPDGTIVRQLLAPHPFGGLVFVHEDVTDRIALERNYNTLIAVQRESLDALREGIAVFGPDGRLTLHNPAFRRIWNLDDADLADRPHASEILERTRDLHHAGDDWPTFRRNMVAVLLGRSPSRTLLDRRDRSVLDTAVAPLTDGSTMWSCSDITASHRIATALKERNEALVAADRLKSRFVANVSYELRTPLSAILGFSEMLAAGYLGELTSRQAEYCNGIVEASRRLARLIDDILDLATVQAGQARLDLGAVEVEPLIEGAMAMARERADLARQTLVAVVPRDVGSIVADERRLRQVLYNLLANAVQFSAYSGTIRVEASRSGDTLTLSVCDDGPGIPKGDRNRVLEAFERGTGDQAGSRGPGTGAGLGLTLVKWITELHGGHVAIDNGPGGGAMVSLVLPVTARPPAGSEPPSVRQTALP